jgi:hypothetical protein
VWFAPRANASLQEVTANIFFFSTKFCLAVVGEYFVNVSVIVLMMLVSCIRYKVGVV